MPFLHACVRNIDAFTDFGGRCLAWLCLAMAVVTTIVVIMRYGFNAGSIMAQESVVYMHGSLFLLGAAYALKQGAHVRVDIFYRNFSPRRQAWINALGGIIFLLPFCLFIVGTSASYVAESWAIREVSPEPGGIPAVFLLKTLILAGAANLALQGLAEVLRSTLQLVEGE